jgi:HAD superfamily hydrolase (TIGR01509 family)
MVMRMLRALILDFDGLIIDSETAVAGALSEVFAREGHEFPEDIWRSMVGTRENDGALWTELERLTGRRIDVEAIDAKRRARGVQLADELQPLPGVISLLDQAREGGLRIAVASSSSSWWVCGHLERLGLAERFDVVRTREDAARSKPYPDVYLEALAGLGVKAGETVAFEDSAPGVSAAKAAGLRVVAVPGSYTEHMDFSQADRVVESLQELPLETLLEEFG